MFWMFSKINIDLCLFEDKDPDPDPGDSKRPDPDPQHYFKHPVLLRYTTSYRYSALSGYNNYNIFINIYRYCFADITRTN